MQKYKKFKEPKKKVNSKQCERNLDSLSPSLSLLLLPAISSVFIEKMTILYTTVFVLLYFMAEQPYNSRRFAEARSSTTGVL